MAGRRIERLNEQFRRELTEIVQAARDPRLEQVTFTAVRVSPDLTFARVFVAPASDEARNAGALAGLVAASPFLRRELGARLHVRRIPELRFELDETLARAQRIESLLHQVTVEREQGNPPPAPPDDEDHAG